MNDSLFLASENISIREESNRYFKQSEIAINALKNIMKHQELVMKDSVHTSTTWRIANEAMEKINENN